VRHNARTRGGRVVWQIIVGLIELWVEHGAHRVTDGMVGQANITPAARTCAQIHARLIRERVDSTKLDFVVATLKSRMKIGKKITLKTLTGMDNGGQVILSMTCPFTDDISLLSTIGTPFFTVLPFASCATAEYVHILSAINAYLISLDERYVLHIVCISIISSLNNHSLMIVSVNEQLFAATANALLIVIIANVVSACAHLFWGHFVFEE
jgi:hypothetical protein